MNINYSTIARESFPIKFTFYKPISFHTFTKLHEELRRTLLEEKISYLDYDYEHFELSSDVLDLKKTLPKEKVYSEGLVYFSDIGSFDNWLRKFKYIVVETFKSADVQVTEVYVNGGEYVSDPNAWFPIPELNS